ncbi:MAG: HEAT repeat domain-containing protein [Clostridiales bacterium]|jgi:3-methyladenine DNA glycosylase AlkC|nr:HEAT repeat domain-containing protein [Clostridiales bacterium]
MVDIEYYTKLFFNEKTGKERYSIIPKEAEKIFSEKPPESHWNIAMGCYGCDLYYIQMLGVYILGLIGSKDSLSFLKNTVSLNPSWQVQEFLAMAFDVYCKKNGYEKSLGTINKWLNDPNPNVRRAVIEGLRVWTKRTYFEKNPQDAINIISEFKEDESEYVRKSVGNALKDISKTRPDLVKEELSKWKLDKKEVKQVYMLATKLMKKKE